MSYVVGGKWRFATLEAAIAKASAIFKATGHVVAVVERGAGR